MDAIRYVVDSDDMRHVTLICGPPCAGKTTLARQLAQTGDRILDLDDIALRLGSDRHWRHTRAIAAQAEQHMLTAMDRIARSDTVTAYIVRCLPIPGDRARLARTLGADVIVIKPPINETLRRCRLDRRPHGTESSIRYWYRNYRPHELDQLVPIVDLTAV